MVLGFIGGLIAAFIRAFWIPITIIFVIWFAVLSYRVYQAKPKDAHLRENITMTEMKLARDHDVYRVTAVVSNDSPTLSITDIGVKCGRYQTIDSTDDVLLHGNTTTITQEFVDWTLPMPKCHLVYKIAKESR